MSASPLSLQRLPRARDRVLALGQLVALRAQSATFSRDEIIALGEQLRLPRLGDVMRELTRLKDEGFVMRRRDRGWAVTPEGEQHLLNTVGELAPLTRDVDVVGAVLGTARHQVIPAALAPEPWMPAISRLLERQPFDRNVLLMTRFPRQRDDPLVGLIESARSVCTAHGLKMHLAGDENADPVLFNNVAAYMWACRFGLAFFEAHGDPPNKPAALNQNLLIEVGGMLMAGRRCAILRDSSVEQMPTDLVGHIFHSLNLADLDAATAQVHRALVRDFGTARCPRCPAEAAAAA